MVEGFILGPTQVPEFSTLNGAQHLLNGASRLFRSNHVSDINLMCAAEKGTKGSKIIIVAIADFKDIGPPIQVTDQEADFEVY